MQTIGYIIINGEKLLLLVRQTKTCRYLKLRISGSEGIHLKDEEIFLNNCFSLIYQLKLGKTIII